MDRFVIARRLIAWGCFLLIGGIASNVRGEITVDGMVSPGEYGLPFAVQTAPTGFGNATQENRGGSELNAMFARLMPNGDLALALTGNLETNGNGLVLFIDTFAGGAVDEPLESGFGPVASVGGQRIDDWGNDTDGGSGVNPTPGGSSILEPEFNPDIGVEINASGDNYFINIIDLGLANEPNINRDVFLGQNTLDGPSVTQTYALNGGALVIGDVTHAFNNTNSAGISDTDVNDPLSATTGAEFLLSAGFLGTDPGMDIRILAFITNGGGDFLSNQFLPALGQVPNLGGPGGEGGEPLFDSREFVGEQFINISDGPIVPGDMDGNGVFDAFDVAPFELALADFDAAITQVPWINPNVSGDLNGDGVLDAFDVAPFESALAAGGASATVPEPGMGALMTLAGAAIFTRRSRPR